MKFPFALRLGLSLTLLLPAKTAFAQPSTEPAPPELPPVPPPDPEPRPPAPVPPPYYYVPALEDGAAPLRALRPRSVSPMRAGALMLLFDWSSAVPLGSVRDFTDDASFRGIQLDVRYFVRRGVSLGLGVGWQLFDEKKGRATYPIDSGAITATLYRTVEIVPLLATVHVHPGAYGPVKPFAGIGIGPSYVNFQTLAADLAWTKREWFFTLQPEAGVLIGKDTKYHSVGLNLSVHYTWLPATFGDVTNLQSLGGRVGLYSLF